MLRCHCHLLLFRRRLPFANAYRTSSSSGIPASTKNGRLLSSTSSTNSNSNSNAAFLLLFATCTASFAAAAAATSTSSNTADVGPKENAIFSSFVQQNTSKVPTTACDANSTTTDADAATGAAAAAGTLCHQPSHGFQVQAALEFKDEMAKMKLAVMLNELTKLAIKEQKTKTWKQMLFSGHSSATDKTKTKTKKQQQEQQEIEEQGRISLAKINLNHLHKDTELAMSIIEEIIQAGGILDSNSLIQLIQTATKVIQNDSKSLFVDKRNTTKNSSSSHHYHQMIVVGDMHGCIVSLQQVLKLLKPALQDPHQHCLIIFNGDFVDRGTHSLEVMATLLLLKLAYPHNVVLLRGNHEDTMIASVYGFEKEVKQKYGDATVEESNIWKTIGTCFANLPLGLIADHAFVCHGGLPQPNLKFEALQKMTIQEKHHETLVRPHNETETIMRNILWADPSTENGMQSSPRGPGAVKYGPDVARQFLQDHNIKYLIRAHEPVERGTLTMACGDDKYVVTVFSAADYPNGEGNNLGAILKIDNNNGNAQPIPFTYKDKQEYTLAERLWHWAEEILTMWNPNQIPHGDLVAYLSQNRVST